MMNKSDYKQLKDLLKKIEGYHSKSYEETLFIDNANRYIKEYKESLNNLKLVLQWW